MTEIEMSNILYCINTLASEGGENALDNIKTVSFVALHDFAYRGVYPDVSTLIMLEKCANRVGKRFE